MTDAYDIAGAAVSIDFNVGEQPCKIRPIKVADQFDFEQWARELAMQAIVGSNLTLKQKMQCAKEAISLGWFSDECIAATQTVMGKARLLWLGTRDSHDMSFADFRDTVTEEQLHEGFMALAEISWGGSKKKPEQAKPTTDG